MVRVALRRLLPALRLAFDWPLPATPELRDFDPNVGGGVDRDKLAAGDFAGKNRSFPIHTQADVSDALSSIGRAGADNYSHDELHRRIIAIAKRKGFSVPDSSEDKEKETAEPDDQAAPVPMPYPQTSSQLYPTPGTRPANPRPTRTRRQMPSDGPRRVDSDLGGRVKLPVDLERTRAPGVTLAHEGWDEDDEQLDLDFDYPKLDMDAENVMYQKLSDDPEKCCQTCRFFDADCDGDYECSLVAGNIRPLGVCKLFDFPFLMTHPNLEDEDDDEQQTIMASDMPTKTDNNEDDDVESNLSEVRLGEFAWGVAFAEGKPIQIMRTGKFSHPEYGEFEITHDDLQEIVRNHRLSVRGQDIPIDIDHDHKGGAVGWMKQITVNGDKLFAVPDWTDEGAQAVRSGKYKYFSPHFGPWENPETGEKHRVVLMSGAITNFPFLKHMEPLSLSEFAARREGQEMELAEIERRLAEAEAKAARADELEKRLADNEQRMQMIEHDRLVRKLTDTIHGNGNPNRRWIGNEDNQLTFMLSLAEKFGEDSTELRHYVAEQDASADRLRQSGLFRERGTAAGGQPNTARDQIEVKLTEAAQGATDGKARAKALMETLAKNRALYNQYDQETVIRVDQDGRN